MFTLNSYLILISEDNTYPNLMAILTGFNNTLSYNTCDPKQMGKLEQCPFIWKHFQDSGYITAYAEDEVKINTVINISVTP